MKGFIPILLLIVLGTTSVGVSAHEGHCEDTELGYIMSKMKKSFKKLNREISRGDYEDASEYVAELIKLSKDSIALKPLKLKDDASLSFEKYQSKMQETEQLFQDLLVALNEKNESKASEIVDSIKKLRKSGHKEFRKECD